jgi:hypothetical protein
MVTGAKRSNNGPMAPAFVRFSRNSQIVRASATRSDIPSPRKRRNGNAIIDQELGALIGKLLI